MKSPRRPSPDSKIIIEANKVDANSSSTQVTDLAETRIDPDPSAEADRLTFLTGAAGGTLVKAHKDILRVSISANRAGAREAHVARGVERDLQHKQRAVIDHNVKYAHQIVM
jgi:hypothetical protein